jgi:hypothetical protein
LEGDELVEVAGTIALSQCKPGELAMLFKHLFIGALAATSLSISSANATVVTWDFSDGAHSSIPSPAAGNLGDNPLTQFSVPLGVPVVATGFASIPGLPFSMTSCGARRGLVLVRWA